VLRDAYVRRGIGLPRFHFGNFTCRVDGRSANRLSAQVRGLLSASQPIAIEVAAHGQPYLVYWSGPNGQHLAFSDWNSVTLPGAPAPSQVVSISDLR
jgi:hypothetical protein